ncbi:KN motif and ankyrin repeat domain-containing protein 1b isoform X2 [Tachysurus fulvidraco]|uniref:KN motif and ankyrin repeat domain-containing protein 1b isoform X2 n=1 Tax=Tachysurus fulvidraco TaxID=1234273 RepID=UPI001FEE00E1|nr:KN motif and ankyrin repeat domain-containing protein 1b isoform X2 [Tachysurus fulvidraco]
MHKIPADGAEPSQNLSICFCTPYTNDIEVDFKYVDGIKYISIIQQLGFNRRPRAKPLTELQSGIDPLHWASSGLSVSNNETRNSCITSSSSSSSSVNRRKPPLPPSHSSSKSTSESSSHKEALNVCQNSSDGKTRRSTTSKQNSLVERALVETQKCLEQEKSSLQTVTSEAYPWCRLASFAGLASSNILPPQTSCNALNHTQSQENHKGSKLTDLDQSSSGSRSSRTSPMSSGRTNPVTTVSPLNLKLVRDQMVVALERLKEMEEQVKVIPVLQVKISVLKEERKQLRALVKNLESKNLDCNPDPNLHGVVRKRAYSTGSTVYYSKPENDDEGQKEPAKMVDSWECNTFKQQQAEMHMTISDQENMVEEFVHSGSCCKDVATENKLNVRTVGVGVTESMLGVVSDTMLEFEIQPQTIQVLKDKVQTLECKEAMLKAELCMLKSEIPEAGATKNSSLQPEVQSIATQTGMLIRTIGIGNHVELVHAAVGEGAVQTLNTVGVTCQPETCDVASGLDTPIEMWEIQKKVEKRAQCVGTEYVPTCSQGVGTFVSVCDVGIMTIVSMENLMKKTSSSRTVGCGDCTVDVNVNMVKPLISQGNVTEPVSGIDVGVILTPQTMSQYTNTEVHTASCCTSTSPVKSSTIRRNMLTQARHTNTAQITTRTLAIGDGKVVDQQVGPKMCSIGVGTPVYLKGRTVTPGTHKVMTRDTGVGLANINENFLVGLRTRNMACGPSRLPDPNKTRSIGVEVGDGRIRDMNGHMWMPVHLLHPQTEPGLDHYIDRMQRLLKEQQSLLTSSHFKQKDEVALQPQPFLDTQHGVPGHDPSSKSNDSMQLKSKNLMGHFNDDNGTSTSRSIITRKDISLRCAENRKSLKPLSAGFECLSITEESFSERTDSEVERRKRIKQIEEGHKTSTKSSKMERRQGYEMSDQVISACHKLKAHLNDTKVLSNRELRSCLNIIQQDWFCESSQKKACPEAVDGFLSMCRHVSPAVLTQVANMADQNGNTALHYSVSHSNFRVVQKLLDAGVCNVNQQNKAGYTPIMLAALAAVETKEDMSVVEGLFRKGDVNAKAIQAGQTALMLAVSHGRMDMVKILLATGSKVNIQDDEGSTALMCASEHGHVDIVRLLLAQPGCDATLRDNDDSTAMSIALDAGHNDIAMLMYAHINYGMGQPLAIS